MRQKANKIGARGSILGRRVEQSYWPEIDGLRAVAVSLVILNHMHHFLAPGGFVGVDMFFVISGFVVTISILRAEGPSIW